MAEAVDSIVAVLEARIGNYATNFKIAAAALDEHTEAVKRSNAVQSRLDGTNGPAAAEEATTEKVKRTRKARTDASIAADKTETASAKAAAKEKADAGIAEAERELAAKRRMANIEAGIAERAAQQARAGRSGTLKGTGNNDGPQRPLASNAAAFINTAEPAAEVAAAKEVDHLKADLITKQAGLAALSGKQLRDEKDLIATMRLQNQLRSQGVAEEEVLARAEALRSALASKRAQEDRAQSRAGLTRFTEGAGLGRTGGSGAAIAGIGAAVAAAAIVSAVDSAVARGKEIAAVSAQLGISTKQLQVYEAAAAHVGVTNEQVRSSFGQLQNEIGKAKEGDQTAGKAFAALGVDIKSVGSAGDVLPTLIDRLSSIKDPAQRAALETKLFGEEGRKLDRLLSGGNQRIDEMSAALERTGAILSDPDIRNLDKTAAKLEAVKNQLGADISGVVADNANAIQTLAGTFANLASNVLKYAAAQDRAAAASVLKLDPLQRDIPSMAIGALGGKSRAQQIAENRATLLQSPEGRKILLDQNRASIRSTAVEVPLDNGRDTAATQEVRNQRLAPLIAERKAIYQAAREQAKLDAPPKVQVGKVNQDLLSKLDAPKPPKGPKGKSEETLEKEAEARLKRFQDQLSSLQEEQLRAQQALTGDIEERAKIERDLADRALAKKLADIESQRRTDVLDGEDKGVAASRARQLSAEATKANLADKAVTEQQRQADTNSAITAHLEQSLSSQGTLIDTQLALAKTAKERLRLELLQLDNAKKIDRAGLQRQLDTLKPGDPARQDVEARIKDLGADYDGRRKVTLRQNQGPIADYRDSLADPQRQIEQAVADKLKSVDQAITDAASNVLGIKDPFLKSLLQIFLQQNVLRPLYDAFQSAQGGGGGGIGGLFSSLLKIGGSFLGGGGGIGAGGTDLSFAANGANTLGSVSTSVSDFLPHFANGGSFLAGGTPGIDKNVLSIGGQPRAMVGAHETISVNNPNVAASNRPVQNASSSPIVIAPQHYDLAGVVMTESLVQGLREDNRRYADMVGKAAVQASGAQAPGIIQRKQTLEN